MTALLAGFAIGLAGSGHCAGMCGPLLLSVAPQFDRARRAAAFARLLLYHAGRLSVYVLLAVPVGLAGQMLSVRGLGRAVAVAGALLLLVAAFEMGGAPLWRHGARRFSMVAARGCAAAARWGRGRPVAGAIAAGAANGLLPCGLVYAAVAASAGAGSPAGAALTMLGFGLGTLPVLLAVSMSAASLSPNLRLRLHRLTPVVLVLAAVLLLARAFDVTHQAGHAPARPTVQQHH